MLKNIHLQNFKPFGENLSPFRLAPITLIYGPNSSGKSSIIQALQLMAQTIRGQRPFALNELILPSEIINLGNFMSLLHKHDPKRKLGIGFDFSPTLDPLNMKRSGEGQDPVSGLSISWSSSEITKNFPYIDRLDFRTLWNRSIFNFQLERIALGAVSEEDETDSKEVNKTVSIKKRGRSNVDNRFSFELEKKSDIESLCGFGSAEDIGAIDTNQARSSNPNTVSKVRPTPELIQHMKSSIFRRTSLASGIYAQEFLPCMVTADESSPVAGSDRQLNEIRNLLRSFDNRLRRTVGSMTYLGPLRTHPQRLYALQGNPSRTVGAKGEQAVQILHHNFSNPDGRTTLLEKLNDVCSRFEIPYRFELSAIGNEITGDHVVLVLVDQRTQVKVAPTDVGFGIGQLLPILIEGLVASRGGNAARIVCVEQPEIHLHPRLQAAMADFFIETAATNKKVNEILQRGGVQWILETHSEALILRIQRRIREGKLSSADVSVLYVDPKASKGSVVEEIRLDERGEFMDLWPDGFFVESYNETLGSM